MVSYFQAIEHLLAAAKENPANDEALSLIIDVVAASQDDTFKNRVIDLLLEEVDGEARVSCLKIRVIELVIFCKFGCRIIFQDPKFLFRLYMAKREYLEAASTAVIIAQQEQINGESSFSFLRMNGIV